MHFFHLHLPGYYTTTAKNDDDGRPLPQKSLNIKKEKGAGIRVSSFPALFSVAIMPARVLIKFSFSKSHQAAISSRKIVRKRNRPRRTSLLPNNTQTTKKTRYRERRDWNKSKRPISSHQTKRMKRREELCRLILSFSFLCCVYVCVFSPPLLRQRQRDLEGDEHQQQSLYTEQDVTQDQNKFGRGPPIKWAVENGKMAAWRAMPDGGKGGSYKLQLYHEKHPHQGKR